MARTGIPSPDWEQLNYEKDREFILNSGFKKPKKHIKKFEKNEWYFNGWVKSYKKIIK